MKKPANAAGSVGVRDAAKEERPLIMAERFKTRLCKTFRKTGACAYELRCMFAHGKSDLRTEAQNEAAGLTTEEAVKAWQRAREAEAAAAQAHDCDAARSAAALPSHPMPRGTMPPPSVVAVVAEEPTKPATAAVPTMKDSSDSDAVIPTAASDSPRSVASAELTGVKPFTPVDPLVAAFAGGMSASSRAATSLSASRAPKAAPRRYRHDPYTAVPSPSLSADCFGVSETPATRQPVPAGKCPRAVLGGEPVVLMP
eukprot:CAMPEP_0174826830 /NCGR_PEP_ID=MMETSP1114-20130205/260_1 /TAXON_ID=312471 /ORGANISM="Neobodo designis, Strain CCAP 1951/1" /LENGTH=255 /DNA_ID=CAMNT_0016060397 /DNA_START=118 /DNA_END=885 /DNA_ORIENTATION=+